MKCRFEHDGDCCNSGAAQYMRKCKQPCDTIIPPTNADRIRAMTDEELAELGARCAIEFFENGQSGYYKRVWKTSDGNIFSEEQLAVKYELQWLKQPAEV